MENARKEEELEGPFLCRHCNHEGPQETFGKKIICPQCGSSDVVSAEFWRELTKMYKDGK